MRIRSVLAATVLGLALATAGATSAVADEGPRHYGNDHYGSEGHYGHAEHGKHHGVHAGPVCSPYFGKIDTVSSDIVWGGAHCGWF
ncbi:hypothetical protein ACFY30_13445 [Streptomyces sp. NPDC000345]|uniref:hypothetical protein n=1 Tax=unclassified Streptomyces TaxID=2593676 RepID=UPI0036AE2D85